MKYTLSIFLLAFVLMAMKNDKPAYKIFTEKGKQASYSDILDDAKNADIVFFGEMHDNPICHWLEYELEKDLYVAKGKNLVVGAEMFESDNQLIVNEYLSKLVSDKSFEAEARLWPNYKTDYKPLIAMARDSAIRFIATDVPRRYAAMVNHSGFGILSTLDPEALKLIAPLPVKYDPELPCYKDILESMGGAMHIKDSIGQAQALKDATMAYFISKNWAPGNTFLHFNGSYHSDKFQSILWYLKKLNPSLKIMTISSVQQSDVDNLDDESKGLANYIVVVPETMTKTRTQ
jgi:uncharacterized iron-regulated protein